MRDQFQLPQGGRKLLMGRWDTLMQGLGIRPSAHAPLLDDLLTRYSEPHRVYHNLAHVHNLLSLLNPTPPMPVPDIELAVWFHDAIYDTTQPHNEAHSAALAEQKLAALGLDAGLIDRVAQLILATQTHQATDPQMQYFLEADLSILGAPEKTYRAYAQAIRREYGWVPTEVFNARRASILEAFLSRPQLFETHPFQSLEGQARANLRAELEALRAVR